MPPQLGRDQQDDRAQKRRDDPAHHQPVGRDAARHGAQQLACAGDAVVGAVQGVARVEDGLALAGEVFEDGDAEFL